MEETLVVRVPAGPSLEGRLGSVESPKGGFVLCHPHPLYGGDMDNPVVIRAAEVAQAADYTTLRFNFRGVGASEGVHDKGQGEQEDVRAAMAALAAHLPGGAPVGVIGYSFGAWTAAHAVRPSEPTVPLALVAPPIGMYDWGFLQGGSGKLLLVAGSRDSYCPVEELHRVAAAAGGEAHVVEGADHFFFGKLYPLGEVIGAWLAQARAGG